MQRFYHMIYEDRDGVRREYTSKTQGKVPKGTKLIGVCGYFDKPDEKGENLYDSKEL